MTEPEPDDSPKVVHLETGNSVDGPETGATDRDDEWMPPRSHPPAGTIIQPSRGARMRAVLLGVAMIVPMLALLPRSIVIAPWAWRRW